MSSRWKIILTSHVGEIRLPIASVLRIERAGLVPCLWRGLVISHRVQYPGCVGFVPEEVSTREILEHLRERGYWVVF